MKACAYYRMSSDKQEASVPAQRKEVTRYAKEHGYQIVREYVDEGISGDATEKRRAFQDMAADAGNGQWSIILCWDQDRFGRFDPIEGGYWIKPLRDAGVTLETVAQGRIDWNDFAGRIIWTVQQEAKHAYLKDLSRNVLRGHIENAKQGGRLAGVPPLGYQWEGDVLVSSADADLVRGIFRATMAGESLRSIARQLGTTRRGTLWSANAVRIILRNPVYQGDYVWGRRKTGKYYQFIEGRITQAERQSTSSLTSDVVVIEGRHEGLVTREEWQRCQDILTANRRATAPVPTYLFSGLVVCGHCLGQAHGMQADGRLYYACSNRRNGCRYYRGRESRIFYVVVEKLRERIGSKDLLDRIRRTAEQELRRSLASVDLKAERQKLAALDQKLNQAAARLLAVGDDLFPVVQAQATRLKCDRDALATKIREHETAEKRLARSIAQEVEELEQRALLLPNISEAPAETQRAFFRGMLSKIVLRWETDDTGKLARHKLKDYSLEFRTPLLRDL